VYLSKIIFIHPLLVDMAKTRHRTVTYRIKKATLP